MADAGLTHGVWLERVPHLVNECVEEWGLSLGEPYEAGAAGYVVRAELPDGTPAVLKLIYPHRESEHEAAALSLWDGDGAVRLLVYDEARNAPGSQRSIFRPLADEAMWWVDDLPAEWERAGKPFERRLVDVAVDRLRALSETQGEQVLLHQDLHGDNILAAQREPWLAIDPKPLVGEREFSVAPIVRDSELGHSRRDVLYGLDRLTAELGLDRDRARDWTIGQTIAWSFDTSYLPKHVQTVRWLLDSE